MVKPLESHLPHAKERFRNSELQLQMQMNCAFTYSQLFFFVEKGKTFFTASCPESYFCFSYGNRGLQATLRVMVKHPHRSTAKESSGLFSV